MIDSPNAVRKRVMSLSRWRLQVPCQRCFQYEFCAVDYQPAHRTRRPGERDRSAHDIEQCEDYLRLPVDLVDPSIVVAVIDLISVDIIASVLDRHIADARRDVLANSRIPAEPVARMQPSKTAIRNPVAIDILTLPSDRLIVIAAARIAACDTDVLRQRSAAPKQNGIFAATDAIRDEATFELHKTVKLFAQPGPFTWRNAALAYASVDLHP